MNKKQKVTFIRIIITLLSYIAVMALNWAGRLPSQKVVLFGIYFAVYLFIGWDILFKAVRNICHGQVFDENFLMAVATVGALGCGEYPEAVAVMLFDQIGQLFESYAVGRSRKSIADLMDICPEYANIEKDGRLEQVDPDEVAEGEVIVVKPGERIPLDGIVLTGNSMVDTSALTGEAVPRSVKEGCEIISGCVNISGMLHVRVTKAFEDSTVTKILELVENASSKKAKMENFITQFARYYTPSVVCGAVLLAFVPPLFLGGWLEWIRRACIFLVISCPCALVISVPLSFFGGIGAASRQGILVKGSNFLEALAHVKTIVFDKTGTLTKGEFKVAGVHSETLADQEVLEKAALAESYSDHPIARSILEAYKGQADLSKIQEVREISGHGMMVLVEDKILLAGNEKLMCREHISYKGCTELGTIVYVAEMTVKKGKELAAFKLKDDLSENEIQSSNYLGCIVICDTVKEEAAEAIAAIKSHGVRKTVMLTGDKKKTAEGVGKLLGLEEIAAELLPEGKVSQVEKLLGQKADINDKVAFVGDGINDAPVLARADIGIAMGSMGSDAAIEAADIVLMDDNILKIPLVIKIARKTMKIVKENIIFALGVKLLVLALGAFGMANMWEAVFADVGVLVLATLNATRTLRIR